MEGNENRGQSIIPQFTIHSLRYIIKYTELPWKYVWTNKTLFCLTIFDRLLIIVISSRYRTVSKNHVTRDFPPIIKREPTARKRNLQTSFSQLSFRIFQNFLTRPRVTLSVSFLNNGANHAQHSNNLILW